MFSSIQSFGAEQGLGSGFAASAPPATAPTQEPGARRPRQEDKQTCLPVTVRAIERALEQRADGEGLRFFGSEAGMLALVGTAEALLRQPASLQFSLDDGTGRIKARHYVTDRLQAKELEELEPGRYVSLFGSVRTAPEVHLAVTGLRPVLSGDEVSFHMIEAAHAALKLSAGARLEPGTPAPARAAAPAAEAAELSPPKAARPAEQPRGQLSGKALQAAVLGFLRKEGEGRAEGLSFAAVCAHADPTPAEDVSATLKRLVADGEIFTTIDDSHYACV